MTKEGMDAKHREHLQAVDEQDVELKRVWCQLVNMVAAQLELDRAGML